jgi:hypothetical protein
MSKLRKHCGDLPSLCSKRFGRSRKGIFDCPEELTEELQDPPDDVAIRIRKTLGDYIRPFPVPAVEDLPASDVGDLPAPLRLEDAVYASLDSNFSRNRPAEQGATAYVEPELGYNFIHLEERCTAPSDLFIQAANIGYSRVPKRARQSEEPFGVTGDDNDFAGAKRARPDEAPRRGVGELSGCLQGRSGGIRSASSSSSIFLRGRRETQPQVRGLASGLQSASAQRPPPIEWGELQVTTDRGRVSTFER